MYQGNNGRGRGNFRNNFRRVQPDTTGVVRAIVAAQALTQVEEATVEEEYFVKNHFVDFSIGEQLMRNVMAKGYVEPTPIQDQAIPSVLAGRDVIGIANTGTGKTAAFLIPLIDKVAKKRMEKVLIVTPTRELALQIYQEFNDFARGLGIFAALCIGGVSIKRQKSDLARGSSFVIGTPGRLKDLIGERSLNLSSFGNVVLDEADRMVDIGFIGEIKYFLAFLPRTRQSLFFSATISGKVREILQQFVHDPVTVSVKKREITTNIHQEIVRVVDKTKKVDQLHGILNQEGFDKVLVFGRTKHGIEKLTTELMRRGHSVGAIHGNKNQNQRQKVLQLFKSNQIKVLLATDVASRGLDIDGVSHVINYDVPTTYEDYVHRIGRTGRVNKRGVALTFVE